MVHLLIATVRLWIALFAGAGLSNKQFESTVFTDIPIVN